MPAPTGTVQVLKPVVILWERARPRRGRPGECDGQGVDGWCWVGDEAV